METRRKLVVRVQGQSASWMQTDVFRDRNLAEFVIAPLCSNDGPASLAVFATADASGFRTADHTLLEDIRPALRTACELRSLRQAELTLLDTYVGDAAAQRILAGSTRRGQIESLEAALLLCDLRDFTGLSNRLPSDRVLELLNGYFDRVIPSIVDAGGEVLKFMGDHESPLSPRCRRLAACWGNLRVGPQPQPNSMPASHSITAISATAISALALASISP